MNIFGTSLGTIIDGVNGAYECMGGFVVLTNVIRLHREKKVHGINPWATGFFASWGLWNLIFYPFVGAWLSFIGGLWLVLVNGFWFFQLYHYDNKQDEKIIMVPDDVPAEFRRAA